MWDLGACLMDTAYSTRLERKMLHFSPKLTPPFHMPNKSSKEFTIMSVRQSYLVCFIDISHQMGSCDHNLDTKELLRADTEYWAVKTLKHRTFHNNRCCSLNTFPLLNGSISMPFFLNEANLQAVKQACINDG